MRVLPRTVRRTWLLAGAVWLVGCAAVWWALPVRPRAVLHLPDTAVLGFGPGGKTLLVARSSYPDPNDGTPLTECELLDAANGRRVATLFAQRGRASVVGHCRDGRTWVVQYYGGTESSLIALDVVARTAVPMTVRLDPESETRPWCVSPDGRFCAICAPRDVGTAVLWDLVANRQYGVMPGVRPPIAFSADGSTVAAVVQHSETHQAVRVFDLATLATRATFEKTTSDWVTTVELSADGAFVAADFRVLDVEPGQPGMELCVWDVASRTLRARDRNLFSEPKFDAQGLTVLTTTTSGLRDIIRGYDLAGGGAWEAAVPAGLQLDSGRSPDGRTLLLAIREGGAGPLERLATRFDAPWPFARAGVVVCIRLIDATTRQALGEIIVPAREVYRSTRYLGMASREVTTLWSSDGRRLAVVDPTDPAVVQVWDVPPRKPVAWFVAAAVGLGAVLAGLAAWRVRRAGRQRAPAV